jgi:phage gp37-like protein
VRFGGAVCTVLVPEAGIPGGSVPTNRRRPVLGRWQLRHTHRVTDASRADREDGLARRAGDFSRPGMRSNAPRSASHLQASRHTSFLLSNQNSSMRFATMSSSVTQSGPIVGQ